MTYRVTHRFALLPIVVGMLFMTALVVWVSVRGTSSLLDFSARIPLQDDADTREGGGNG